MGILSTFPGGLFALLPIAITMGIMGGGGKAWLGPDNRGAHRVAYEASSARLSTFRKRASCSAKDVGARGTILITAFLGSGDVAVLL